MKTIKSIEVNFGLINHEHHLSNGEGLALTQQCKLKGIAHMKNEMRRQIRPNLAESQDMDIKEIPFNEIKIKFKYNV